MERIEATESSSVPCKIVSQTACAASTKRLDTYGEKSEGENSTEFKGSADTVGHFLRSFWAVGWRIGGEKNVEMVLTIRKANRQAGENNFEAKQTSLVGR